MRKFTYPALFLVMTCGMAHAADPLGDWLVEDKVATIKIVDCNSRLWGVVSAEKTPGGTDSQNPDKTKRTRSTLGMPVLLNMKKVADEKDKWEGQIYNAKNGKTYEASIQLKSPNRLEVEGCVMSILCGGQTWTRAPENVSGPNTKPLSTSSASPVPGAKTSPPPAPPVAGGAKSHPAPGHAPPKVIGQKTGPVDPAPVSEICLLPEIAGAAH